MMPTKWQHYDYAPKGYLDNQRVRRRASLQHQTVNPIAYAFYMAILGLGVWLAVWWWA